MSTFNGSRVNALANALSNNIEANNPLSSEEALAYFKEDNKFRLGVEDLRPDYVTEVFTNANNSGGNGFLFIPFKIPKKNLETGETKVITHYFTGMILMASDNSADLYVSIGKYVYEAFIQVLKDAESGETNVVVGSPCWYEIDFS